MKKFLITVLILAFLLLAVAFGYVLFSEEDQPLKSAGEKLASMAGGNLSQKVDKNSESYKKELNVKKDTATEADILEVIDYEKSKNQDVCAYLKIDGTKISDVVLQSFDNNVYLRKNEKKEPDVFGCYFADADCSLSTRDELSSNTIIYGHSDLKDNPDGKRFSQLFKYTDEGFAKEHPYITLATLQDYMKWEIFSVFYTDTSFNYIEAEPANGAASLSKQAMEKSLFDFGISVEEDDKILTLSTCSVKYKNDGNQRFVVMARLVDE